MYRKQKELLGNFKEALLDLYKKCNEIGQIGNNQGQSIKACLELYSFIVYWYNNHFAQFDEFLSACRKVKFGRFKMVYKNARSLKRWIESVENDYIVEALPDGNFQIKTDIEYPEIKAAYLCGLAENMIMGLVGEILNTADYGVRFN